MKGLLISFVTIMWLGTLAIAAEKYDPVEVIPGTESCFQLDGNKVVCEPGRQREDCTDDQLDLFYDKVRVDVPYCPLEIVKGTEACFKQIGDGGVCKDLRLPEDCPYDWEGLHEIYEDDEAYWESVDCPE